MENDRRQQPRGVPQTFAFIQVEKDEGGRVLNISESGLCFEVFSTVRVAEVVRFWFTFNLNDRIEAFGRLVWFDAINRIGGLAFTNLSHAARKQIQYWTGRMPLNEPPMVSDAASLRPELRIPNAPLRTPEVHRPNVALQPAVPRSSKASLCPPPPADPSPTRLPAPKLEATEKNANPLGVGPISEPHHGSSGEGHLVPFERYRRTARSQFLRGLAVGMAVSAAVAIPVFKLAQAGRPNVAAQPPAISVDSSASAGEQSANSSPGPLPASFAPVAKSHDSRPNLSSQSDHASDTFSPGTGRSPASPNKAGSSVSQSVDPYAPNDLMRSSKSWRSPKQLWAAVQAGNTNAAVILADHYIHGEGVPVNCDQARVLLLFASEKNNKEAIQKLRDLDKTDCSQTQTPPQ